MRKGLSLAIALHCTMMLCGSDKVLVIGLGDHLYPKDGLEMVDRFYASLQGKGVNCVWSGPFPWNPGYWKDPEFVEFVKAHARIIKKYGMKTIYNFSPNGLFNAEDKGSALQGKTLDSGTGKRVTAQAWDYASPEAFAELTARSRQYMTSTKPYDGFSIDEVILIEPGTDSFTRRMSQYWTSPTYSDAALADFRRFVKALNLLPDADKVKFPVTTQMKEPSEKYNMGLPAVPLTPENSEYLTRDDDYPASPLWKAWMAWRVDLLTRLHKVQYELAEEILADGNPGWIGCFSSAPTNWYCTEAGLDKYQIAAIPQLTYIVAGYCKGLYLETLKDAAAKNNKLLGGMIETSVYGRPDPLDGKSKILEFKNQVGKGARCMLLYPLSNFNAERTEKSMLKEGRGYQPETIKTWAECVKFLRNTGRAVQ